MSFFHLSQELTDLFSVFGGVDVPESSRFLLDLVDSFLSHVIHITLFNGQHHLCSNSRSVSKQTIITCVKVILSIRQQTTAVLFILIARASFVSTLWL